MTTVEKWWAPSLKWVKRENMEHLANWAPQAAKLQPKFSGRLLGSGALLQGLCRAYTTWDLFELPNYCLSVPLCSVSREKQRYSVDIKDNDTQNLPVSKKLNTPDPTLPSVLLARTPALCIGSCSNQLAAGSKHCSFHSGFPAVFLLGWRMVLLKRYDPAWNAHLLHMNHHFRSKIIHAHRHILHVSM